MLLLRIFIYITLGVLLLFTYVKHLERSSVYFPSREIEFTPKTLNLEFQDIYFQTPDKVQLNAWHIPAEGKYTILFCHGNGGNISHRLSKINIFNQLGLNVFIFDYRGYGKSQGAPSEAGLYQDAQAAYKYLTDELKHKKIIAYGESLGSAVAIDMATKKDIAAVIIEGGFASAQEMGKILYPFVPGFIYSIKFDSINKISQLDKPVLFFHAVNDEMIPIGQARALFEKTKSEKYFIELSGSHNDAALVEEEKFKKGLNDFIKRLD